MTEGASDIVIEILSTDRNRDLARKRQVYDEAGVPEYWGFDESRQTVSRLELRGGRYVERAAFSAEDALTTPRLPGPVIPLSDVFHRFLRPAWNE